MLECLFLSCREATGPLGIWFKSLFGLIVKLLCFPLRSHHFKVHNVHRQESGFTFIVKLLYFTEIISRLLMKFRQGNSRWRMSLLNHPRAPQPYFHSSSLEDFNISRAQRATFSQPRCFHPRGSTTHFSGILFEATVSAIRRRLCTQAAGSPGDTTWVTTETCPSQEAMTDKGRH